MAELFTAFPVNRRHDPRMLRAGDRAELVDRRAWDLAKATLSDGVIDRVQLPLIGATTDETAALEREGLWKPSPNGWTIADFLDFNASRVEIDKRRERENERKKNWRKTRDATPDTDGRATEDATEDENVASEDDSDQNHRERETRRGREASATPDADASRYVDAIEDNHDELLDRALQQLRPPEEVPDVISKVRARGYTDDEITTALTACDYPSQLKNALPPKPAPAAQPLRPTIAEHPRCPTCNEPIAGDVCSCTPVTANPLKSLDAIIAASRSEHA